jgi:hypothetical protein
MVEAPSGRALARLCMTLVTFMVTAAYSEWRSKGSLAITCTGSASMFFCSYNQSTEQLDAILDQHH